MKKVKVAYTVTLEEEWEDEYATVEHIEFRYNEGTWCASNLVDVLIERFPPEDGDSGSGCFCGHCTAKVLEIDGVPVATKP